MRWLAISAFIGMLSVVIGAFGAHIAAAKLSESLYKTLQVAIDYHQFYSLFLLVLSLYAYQYDRYKIVTTFLLTIIIVGVLLFSGSLYAYVLTGIKALTFLTPFGGVTLMIAWGILGINAIRLLK